MCKTGTPVKEYLELYEDPRDDILSLSEPTRHYR
jgi:hypothetical protein